jgi:hypothetical protein
VNTAEGKRRWPSDSPRLFDLIRLNQPERSGWRLHARMGHGAAQKAVGGMLGALGATAVMTKFSAVVSAIMHNPKLADMMQRAANGDATSVNAFTRALISGAGADQTANTFINSSQPESQPPSCI